MLKAGEADAFSHVAPMLAAVQGDLPGARMLPGSYFNVPIAIGVAKGRPAAVADFARTFAEHAKHSGLLPQAIARHGVTGVTVGDIRPSRYESTGNPRTIGLPIPQADFRARPRRLVRWRDGKEIGHATDPVRIPVAEIQPAPDRPGGCRGRWRLGDVGRVRVEAGVDRRRARPASRRPPSCSPMDLMIRLGRGLPETEYVEPF